MGRKRDKKGEPPQSTGSHNNEMLAGPSLEPGTSTASAKADWLVVERLRRSAEYRRHAGAETIQLHLKDLETLLRILDNVDSL